MNKISKLYAAAGLAVFSSVAHAGSPLDGLSAKLDKGLQAIIDFMTSGWVYTGIGLVFLGIAIVTATGNMRESAWPYIRHFAVACAIFIGAGQLADFVKWMAG